MRIFNLAEELEKERKKNKELEEKIDKAIQTIEKNENKAPVEVILNDIGEALNILKGDNK